MDNNTYDDLYLKFPNEAAAVAALEGYEGCIDIIGEIDGVTGWHVNTRGPKPAILLTFAVDVRTPFRVWA